MILFKRAEDLSGWLQKERSEGRSIGFVPTMGALHPGHISLIDISKNTTAITVCSIFVNPTQFNDPKDFQKYPITIEKDIFLLEKAGTDVLFLPVAAEMYPGGTKDLEKYELGRLEMLLEGKYRPGHFQGVCQVMRRLLDMVAPDDLFMGQKDYQQCMVVSRLLEIMRSSARLHPSPILREADGLAMSSRNVRLTPADREKAPAIYQALTLVKEEWNKTGRSIGGYNSGPGNTGNSGGVVLENILAGAKAMLEEKGFRIDYLEIADAKTLEPVTTGIMQSTGGSGLKGGHPAAVALVAAFLGEIRLIDNMLL
jgi:pantoate--beta-alanine ligase